MVLTVDLVVMLVVLVCGVSGLDIAWCGLLGLTVVVGDLVWLDFGGLRVWLWRCVFWVVCRCALL